MYFRYVILFSNTCSRCGNDCFYKDSLRLCGVFSASTLQPCGAELSDFGPTVKATVERIGSALADMFDEYMDRLENHTTTQTTPKNESNTDDDSDNFFTKQTFKQVVEKIEDFMKSVT